MLQRLRSQFNNSSLRSQFNNSRMMRGKRKILLTFPPERLARKQLLRRELQHHGR